jgi:hypothetical protein
MARVSAPPSIWKTAMLTGIEGLERATCVDDHVADDFIVADEIREIFLSR